MFDFYCTAKWLYCTAKWLSYMYNHFHTLFHYGLSQDIGYSSLCYIVEPCCLVHSKYSSLHLLITKPLDFYTIEKHCVKRIVREHLGFPGDASGKEVTCQYRRCQRHGFDPWVRKIWWGRVWQPTPVFSPGESMDRGAWQATVHGVARTRTLLKQLSARTSYLSW